MLTDLISIQVIEQQGDLYKYKVLFSPNAQLLDKEDAALLSAYVEQGGTLVMGPRSGYKDRSNRAYMMP
ncbi:beta-galactosidase trimerization domain-containing protein [Paenibacillus whitsoniae]|uniref:Beta-galactosidase trimerisation domain-containing protein n=1 Tax=Paenibacillus whitsoniae TaxID=2496558 RepID=A0A3S0BLC4_9BACL|nr:hypothetical protein EJQ19_12585 [Paenibacillus whitsoniae]